MDTQRSKAIKFCSLFKKKFLEKEFEEFSGGLYFQGQEKVNLFFLSEYNYEKTQYLKKIKLNALVNKIFYLFVLFL